MKRLILLLVAALALTGCSIKTLGAPTGSLTLVARFPDAQNLVAGHSVQMSDIEVGSVRKVKLVGYEAEVTMSIKDGYKIPQGTAAEVALTTLLGENYVKLVMPQGRDMATGPYYANGARIEKTSVAPQFEMVAGNAGRILKAISGDDVGTLVNEGAAALDGQGEKLNTTLSQSTELVGLFNAQRDDLATAIDALAKIGKTLEANKGVFESGTIEKTTALVNKNKEKILSTVEKLTQTAKLLNDKVFEGRAEKLRLLVKRLDPTLKTLGSSRQQLTDLVSNLVKFQNTLPKVVWDGQLMIFAILKLGIFSNHETAGGGNKALPLLDDLLNGVAKK